MNCSNYSSNQIKKWISTLCFLIIGTSLFSQIVSVISYQKISDLEGNFQPNLASGDKFGSDVTEIGDLNDDGIVDFASYAAGDDDGGNLRGALYILFMNTDGTVNHDQKISDLDGNFTFNLQDEDRFGGDITALGDLDGDGVEDIAVGCPNDHNSSGANRGSIFILFMNTDGTVDHYQQIHKSTGYQGGGGVSNLPVNGYFGAAIDAIGDLNGDGVVDLAVGVANRDINGGINNGEVRILFMSMTGKVIADQKISVTNGNFTGALDDYDRFGHSVTNVGDLDNDGLNEIAVGARGDDDGGSSRGAVYILFLNTNGTVNHHQKISNTEGNFMGVLGNSDGFGTSVSDMGDFDGDGVEDLQVGAQYDDDGGTNKGATYILFLDTDGTVKSHQKISSLSAGFTTPLDANDYFGNSVEFIGDLNGDGTGDILVAAYYDDDGGTIAGAAYVIFLELTVVLPIELLEFNATMNYENKTVDLDWTTLTEQNNDYFTVERSLDAQNWENLFDVDGVGNSTTFESYSGVDTDPQYGVSYYRLMQTDFDGQYAYSNVVSVNCNFGSGTFNHQIYPNPASSALNILVDERSNDPISISIYSITGQLVLQQKDISSIGTSELNIDLSNLTSGAYMLVLQVGNDQFQRFKFIKEE